MSSSDESIATYQERLRSQLKEWEDEIDRLRSQLENVSAHARIDRQQLMWNIQEKHEQARDRLADLERAGDELWKELRQGTEDAWKELGDSLERARNAFVEE